jgi:hypothetical protein
MPPAIMNRGKKIKRKKIVFTRKIQNLKKKKSREKKTI